MSAFRPGDRVEATRNFGPDRFSQRVTRGEAYRVARVRRRGDGAEEIGLEGDHPAKWRAAVWFAPARATAEAGS